jgi:hypothetical protein
MKQVHSWICISSLIGIEFYKKILAYPKTLHILCKIDLGSNNPNWNNFLKHNLTLVPNENQLVL